MKKGPVLNYVVLLWLTILFGVVSSCQNDLEDVKPKPNEPSTAQELFKKDDYWNKFYEDREKQAPSEVVAALADMRELAKTEKWTFTVGYTGVFNKPLKEIAGFIPPTLEEIQKIDADLKSEKKTQRKTANARTQLASRFDARESGWVTPARNQGSCGSCWAFASVAAFETSYLKTNGGSPSALDLSEQQVLNCTGYYSTCGGGRHHIALAYIRDNSNGLAREQSYPYIGTDASCSSITPTIYQAASWDWASDWFSGESSLYRIKQAISDYGSVAAGYYATNEFKIYSGGVFNQHVTGWGQTANHIVQIIGWDDNLGAWLIKNSWGSWGLGGFGWIAYNTNLIGAYAAIIVADSVPPAYKIVASHSNKAVEVSNFRTDNGGQIVQRDYWAGQNQRWRLVPTGDGFFYIRSYWSDKNIIVPYFSHGDGTKLMQYDPHTSFDQQWALEYQTDGTVMIRNRHSNKYLDVTGVSYDNGAPLQQWSKVGWGNQKFRIDQVW